MSFEQDGYSHTGEKDLTEAIVKNSHPDLVILTGDILDGRAGRDLVCVCVCVCVCFRVCVFVFLFMLLCFCVAHVIVSVPCGMHVLCLFICYVCKCMQFAAHCCFESSNHT